MRCSVELYHDVAPQVYGDTAFNTTSTLSASVSIHLSDLHLRLTLLSPPIHLSDRRNGNFSVFFTKRLVIGSHAAPGGLYTVSRGFDNDGSIPIIDPPFDLDYLSFGGTVLFDDVQEDEGEPPALGLAKLFARSDRVRNLCLHQTGPRITQACVGWERSAKGS